MTPLQEAIKYVHKILREEAGIEDEDEYIDFTDYLDDPEYNNIATPSHDFADVTMADNSGSQWFTGSDGLMTTDRWVAKQERKETPTGNQQNWETRFQSLVAYKERNGHANPTKSKKANEADMKVGTWCQINGKATGVAGFPVRAFVWLTTRRP